MLNIYFGDMEDAVYDPEAYFEFEWEKSWIEDDFSVQMIKDIDKSDVIAGGIIDSPVLGLIPPERLSGGVKTLILINNVPKRIFNASFCGDNCAKWIVEMGKNKDITINLNHFMDFQDLEFDAHVLNGDEYAHNDEELFDISVKYLKGQDNYEGQL